MGLPWYKWFVRDWLTSPTRFKLSMLERGLYREILDVHYAEGSIPADEKVLARMVAATPEEFAEAWPAVSVFFEPHDKDSSRLVNPRAAAVIKEQDKWQKNQRVNGSKGGRPKKTDGLAKRKRSQTESKPMGFENETQKKARARASESDTDTEQIEIQTPSNEGDTPKPPTADLVAQPKVLALGEHGWAKLTEDQLHKLTQSAGSVEEVNFQIGQFDRWVNDAPELKTKTNRKRKDRSPYDTIASWIARDKRDGKINTANGRNNHAEGPIERYPGIKQYIDEDVATLDF